MFSANIKNKTIPKEKSSIFKTIIDFLKDTIPVVIIMIIFFEVIFRLSVVNGQSMEPTIANNNVVLASHIFYRTQKRGDIIIFQNKKALLREPLIKRIIAVEGDTIDIDFKTGAVILNGEVINETYLQQKRTSQEGIELPLTVPKGKVFVMGDNRNNSVDSRSPAVGLVPVEDIKGKYLFSIIKFKPESKK